IRLIAIGWGPALPATPPRSPSKFAFSFKGIPRLPNLATRSVVQSEGEGGACARATFPGTGTTRPPEGIACGCQPARGVDTSLPQSLRTSARLLSRAGLARLALPPGPSGVHTLG